jgi:uncharacterized membrane protein
MLINPELIPGPLLLLLALLMLAGLAIAVWYGPWQALRAVPTRVHLVLGTSLGCTCLWLMSISLGEVASVHLLAMTSVTLVLGWCLAVLAGSLALLAQLLILGEPLTALPAAWLFSVAVPASLSSWLVSRLPRRQNLFLYTLGGGFAGGMLCALAVAVLATGFLWLAGEAELAGRALEAWPMLALVLFPEGFINGMLVTAACVFFPGAVKTFDEGLYFGDDESGHS